MKPKKARKAFRKLRKKTFQQIIKEASKRKLNVDLNDDQLKFVEDVFVRVWPILKPVLEYAEMIRLTGRKIDKIIRTIIGLGDRIAAGNATDVEQADFIKQFNSIWRYIEIILEIAKIFTDDKTDKIIDDIIEIGEWIVNSKTD